MRLEGKVAVITGAGSGIGRAIAEVFACHGAKIVIAEAKEAEGRETEQALLERGGDAFFVPVDVSQEEQVRRMAAAAESRFGSLDVLVNNAGVLVTGNAADLSEEDWERCLGTDLKGAWLCAKHMLPRLTAPGGSIINIASTHPLRSQPQYLPYAVAKGGMLALTTSMAVDFGPRGIRVNAICPGLIETPLSHKLLAKWKQTPGAYEQVLSLHPLRRIGKPEDVAHAALFLASDEAAFITGTMLVVDGGRLAYAHGLADPRG